MLCETLFGRDEGRAMQEMIEQATGRPCPCQRGKICPLARGAMTIGTPVELTLQTRPVIPAQERGDPAQASV